jgi:hypothetical protein
MNSTPYISWQEPNMKPKTFLKRCGIMKIWMTPSSTRNKEPLEEFMHTTSLDLGLLARNNVKRIRKSYNSHSNDLDNDSLSEKESNLFWNLHLD